MTNSNTTAAAFKRFKIPIRISLFCLVLMILLEVLSCLSLILNRNPDPIMNSNQWAILDEPENTIEVVAIGNSNVRSGLIPMQLWKDYGITSYAWGEPSIDPFDAKLDLKKIFKKQSPSIVILEASFFFRNASLVDNLDSMVRANLASVFPLVTYHRNLAKLFQYDLTELAGSNHSVTKGYYLNYDSKSGKKGDTYMEESSSSEEILNPLVKKEVLKIRQLCEENGAKLIIAAIPSTADWGYERHKLTEEFCNENQLEFLDMNTSDIVKDMKLNWKKDSRDGGTHMNYHGASLVTGYLGKYLTEHYQLTDFRQNEKYEQWNTDCRYFYDEAKRYKEELQSSRKQET